METLPPSSGLRRAATLPGIKAVLEPGMLANLLDDWALRREKVLQLLDRRAARRARVLIERCRRLEDLGFSALLDTSATDPRVVEWLDVRRCVVALICPSMERATGT